MLKNKTHRTAHKFGHAKQRKLPQKTPKRRLAMKVFDQDVKQIQREKAYNSPNVEDFNYLRDEIANRLLERISVIKYNFPNVTVLGNDAGALANIITKRHIRGVLDPFTSKPPTTFALATPAPEGDSGNVNDPSNENSPDEPAPTQEEVDDVLEHMRRYSIKGLKNLTIIDPLNSALKRTTSKVNSLQDALPSTSQRFNIIPFPTQLAKIPQVDETYKNSQSLDGAPCKITTEIGTNGQINQFATEIYKNKSQLVLSNLTLHWENDLPAVFKAAHDMLEPNYAFVGTIIGGETLRELRSAITLAEMERVGGVSHHVSPFAYTKDIGDLLTRAGFEMVSVDIDTLNIPFPDMFTLCQHLKEMGENAAHDQFSKVSRDTWIAANAIYDTLYRNPEGYLDCTVDVIHFIGWKHHDSMHKPAQRGTATLKLGDIPSFEQTEQEQIKGFFSEIKDEKEGNHSRGSTGDASCSSKH